jgi:hypothetical protein
LTPERALFAKLSTIDPFTAIVSTRIYPQLSEQEPQYPLAVYARAGTEQPNTLNGRSSLSKVLIDVTIHAETDEEIDLAGRALVEGLCNPTWTDPTNGVSACFHVDSNVEAEAETRNIRHTFALWVRNPSNARGDRRPF